MAHAAPPADRALLPVFFSLPFFFLFTRELRNK